MQTALKRRWNFLLWAGFLLMAIGLVSYPTFFVFIPETRDFPWATLLLCLSGAVLMSVGVIRAFRQPEIYRGKIAGPILTTLSVAAFAMFALGIFYLARQIPSSPAAPHVGQKAPSFTLPNQNGKSVALADLLSPKSGLASGRANAALLIFYRGHW